MATSGIPDGLKSIRPFILVAKEHDSRDPTLSYFCRRYAVEIGVKMKNRPKDVTTYLVGLMDELEKQKTGLIAKGDEAVTNDIVALAHVENRAMNLFLWADTEDRKGVFNKAVVKSFHTASILFDVLQSFGELTEEVIRSRKYAKWKATYIHGCMKRGETPIPGPVRGDEGAEGGAGPSTSQQPGHPPAGANLPGAYPPPAGFNLNPNAGYPPAGANPPPGGYPDPNPPPGAAVCPPPPQQPQSINQLAPGVPPGHHAPPSTPDQGGAYQSGMPGPSASGVQLQPQDYARAQKLCKFAGSALQYEDVPTAIDNLEKAIRLLKTGRE